MLAVAKRLDDRIEWRQGVAEELPCEDNAFDRVVSQFAMMFFPDRAGAVREIIRVLVPGGRFSVAVWDSLENSPAYSAEVALLQQMAGQDAADALRAPCILGDLLALKRLIEGTAAISVETSTVVGQARFPSIRSMVEADLRGWLPVMGVDLEEDLVLSILAAAEEELSEFVLPNGRMEFASPAHIVSATRATG
jgi:SAM-dependent methyltransferase